MLKRNKFYSILHFNIIITAKYTHTHRTSRRYLPEMEDLVFIAVIVRAVGKIRYIQNLHGKRVI